MKGLGTRLLFSLIAGRPLGELIDSTLSLFNEEEKSKREISMKVLRGAGTSQTRANSISTSELQREII